MFFRRDIFCNFWTHFTVFFFHCFFDFEKKHILLRLNIPSLIEETNNDIEISSDT